MKSSNVLPTYHWNDVSDTITRVDNSSRQGLFAHFARSPRRSQSQHSLNSNVQSLNIERLEHNLGSVFTVLGRVQWGLSLYHDNANDNSFVNEDPLTRRPSGKKWRQDICLNGTHQQEGVVLGLATKILEDTLLPVALHMIPVVDLSVTDRVVEGIGLGVCDGFVSDVKVQIFSAAFGGEVGGLVGGGGVSGDHSGLDERGVVVSGKAHLGEAMSFTITPENNTLELERTRKYIKTSPLSQGSGQGGAVIPIRPS